MNKKYEGDQYADDMLVIDECGALTKDLYLASLEIENAYRSNRTPEGRAAMAAILKKHNDALKDCSIHVKKILDDCRVSTAALENEKEAAHKAYLEIQLDGTVEARERYNTYLAALNRFRTAGTSCWENNKIKEKYKVGGRRKSHKNKSKNRRSRRS